MTALALNTYAGLVEAVGKWAMRTNNTYYTDQIDNFILLSTAVFNRAINPYQTETTTSITTSSSGVGTLPSDFQHAVAMTYSTYTPLQQTSVEGIKLLNPLSLNTIPSHYAITGSSFILDATATFSISLTYVAGITLLSGSNTTNWLLTMAPDAYLYECMAQGEAFNNNWATAQALEQKALGICMQAMDEINVAKMGRSALTLRGKTP